MEPNKRLAKLLVIGFFVLLINSSYLGAYADPTIFYFSNLAFHMALGIGLAITYGYYLITRARQLPRLLLVASVIIGVGALFGGFLMIFGAVHTNWWALYLHIGLGAAGFVFVVVAPFFRWPGDFGSPKAGFAYFPISVLVFGFVLVSARFQLA